MADVEEGIHRYPIDSFQGVQIKTSRFQKKDGDVVAAENIDFDRIGGFGIKPGYIQEGNDLTSTTSTSTSSSTTTTSTSTSTSSSTSSSSTSTSTTSTSTTTTA